MSLIDTQWLSEWSYPSNLENVAKFQAQIYSSLLKSLESSLKPRTIERHYLNLLLLGSHVLKEFEYYPENNEIENVNEFAQYLISNFITMFEGPLVHEEHEESQQKSFDATCKKLFKHVHDKGF
jgi:hypothetical protein